MAILCLQGDKEQKDKDWQKFKYQFHADARNKVTLILATVESLRLLLVIHSRLLVVAVFASPLRLLLRWFRPTHYRVFQAQVRDKCGGTIGEECERKGEAK